MSKEEKGKLRRKELPEVSEPVVNLMPLWLTARCAIQHIRRMYFFFECMCKSEYVLWIRASLSSQTTWRQACKQDPAQTPSSVGIESPVGAWGYLHVHFASIQCSSHDHLCKDHTPVLESQVLSPYYHSALVFHKQQQSFGISGTQKDSKLVSSYSKQSWDSNEP